MPINVELLADICKAPGATGFEKEIRKRVLDEIEDLADEITVDHMGNVTALVKGKSDKKKTMAAAHLDEIGFIVKHIDDNGFIRFHTLGGFDPKTLTAQRVILHGKKDIIGVMGCKPIHIMTEAEKKAGLEIKNYFIDTGLTKKQLEKIIEIGTPITRERELIEMGDCVNVKSLDNRVCVFILIEVLRKIKKSRRKPSYDFYAVFTVQEEVGLRGARVSAMNIQPDFGFGMDTTLACDTPGNPPEDYITSLGEGVAIKIMDNSAICDYRMVEFMKKTAEKKNIKWQPEVLTGGGTDTAAIQSFNPGGAITGAISIPTRYIHQVIEMSHKKDIEAGINLLTECVCTLETSKWKL